MNLLWIDTASSACSVAIGNQKKLHALEKLPARQGQAEKLVPLIQNLLLDSALKIEDIQKIAVTRGPGSFTAVRIGLAVARMLKQVLNIQCIGVSNFELMYQQAQYYQILLPSDKYTALSIHSFRTTPFIQILQGNQKLKEPMSATDEIINNNDFSKVILNEEKDQEFWRSRNINTERIEATDEEGFLHYIIRYCLSIQDGNDQELSPLYIRDADAKVSTKKTKKLRSS